MTRQSKLLALLLILGLAACGGGGGGEIASAPPPVALAPVTTPTAAPSGPTLVSTELTRTPLSGYTALTEGTYPAIAVAYRRAEGSKIANTFGTETFADLAPSAVRLSVEPNRTYSIEFAVPGIPARQSFDLGHETLLNVGGLGVVSDFGRHVLNTYRYSDGSTRFVETDGLFGDGRIPVRETSPGVGEAYGLQLILETPDAVAGSLRYVSYGSWNRIGFEVSGNTSSNFRSSPYDEVRFVTGRRTQPGELPVTGTANYTALVGGTQAVNQDLGGAIRIAAMKLVADFGARSMSAAIDVPFEPDNDCCRATLGIAAAGRGPIDPTGDFRVALSGTTNLGGPTTNPLSGTLQGAFFGPAADETGGVIQLLQGGVPVFLGSFAGGRSGP